MIPKKQKDARYVENWRPITLLNTDYKILAKVTVNRMQISLESLIVKEQTGFMPNRRISQNIRRMLDIIHFTEQSKEPALLLNLDLYKCFDTMAHNSIAQVLQHYGFGTYFIETVMLLYNNLQSCVQNNGYSSTWFPICRGSPQGSPASTAIFLVCGQLMYDLIQNNDKIEGVIINGRKNLMLQFADDTNLFLAFKQATVDAVEQTLQIIYNQIGFRVNYNKTVMYRIGSLRNSNAQLYTQNDITWTNNPINVLGIDICDDDNIVNTNFQPVVQKTENVLKIWKSRKLNLIGKVLLINSLIGSLFVYKMMVLPIINAQVVDSFNKEARKFLWNNKRAKIALKVLQLDKKVGGLRLVDLYKKDLSLKLLWVKEAHEDEFFRDYFYTQLKSRLRERIWKCQLNVKDAKNLCSSAFWGDVLAAWNLFHAKPISTVKDVCSQIIWGNSLIRIDNQILVNIDAWDAGLITVADLYYNDKMLNFEELVSKYGRIMTWFQFTQIVDAIPILWKQILQKDGICWSLKGRNTAIIPGITANGMYSQMIEDTGFISKKKERWEKILNETLDEEEFCKYFEFLYQLTIAVKFRNFQYNLLMHNIVTNRSLFIWKILDHDLCTFCKTERETSTHLFFECRHVFRLWKQIREELLRQNSNLKLTISVRSIMFNEVHENHKHVANFVILITKHTIYKERCFGRIPTLRQVMVDIQKVYQVEEHLAIKNDRWNRHVKKWKPIKNELEYKQHQDFVVQYIENL